MKSQKIFFQIIPSYIIILMPALLISGPFLSDLGVSIVTILFLINSKKNNLFRYYNNIYFKFFIVFCLIIIVSSLLSDNILISLKNSIFYFRFGIFSLCFWYLLEKNDKILYFLFYSIIICFLSLIIDGYIQFFFGKNLFGIEIQGIRVSSFFGSELVLGSYLSRFFPILFGLFIFIDQKLKIKNKKFLFILTIIFILAEGLILLSGERIALFFMNLSAIYIILMINNYKKYRFWTYLASLLLIFGLIIFIPSTQNRIVNQTFNDFTNNSSFLSDAKKNSDKIYIFSKAHNDMYITGLKIFDKNKLFGVGPRQYRNVCRDYQVSKFSCQTHPHNTYIELLSEAGIFAFLLVLGLFLLIIISSLRQFFNNIFNNKKKYFNDFEICLLSAIIISLWPLSPTGSFFHNWMSIVYYFPVGIFLWQRYLNTKSDKSFKK